MSDKLTRCDWAAHDILNQEYHDNEWGNPFTMTEHYLKC